MLNIPLNYKWYTQYRKLTKKEKKYKLAFIEVACSEIAESKGKKTMSSGPVSPKNRQPDGA